MLTAAASALWLGVLTSISPCPLATNIAAISFIGRDSRPWRAAAGGLAYTLGRMFTYVVLGAVAVSGVLAIPQLSFFLSRHMNQLLGPILILVGMVLLELLPFNVSFGLEGAWGERFARGRVLGPFLLGLVFALSLCPVSAALFFGSLIPIAVKEGSRALLPGIYGAGTGLPVAGFALAMALAAGNVGRMFDRVARMEKWLRSGTGVVFILVGIYYVLIYIFEV